MNDRKHTDINPLMIQSYFDGELNSEELEALSHEDLIHSQGYEALSELRRVVRTESALALNDIDGLALLDAINQQIDAESKPVHKEEINPVTQPKRRTTAMFFKRWAPAMVGAALFLLSIPGLVHWIAVSGSNDTQQPQPQTVVVIDSNGVRSNNPALNNGMVNYQAPQNNLAMPTSLQNNQLTVEEMDFAIRHLIQRIETLEEANMRDIESGNKPLGAVPADNGNQL